MNNSTKKQSVLYGDNNKGEKVIDTRSLRNGIYIIGIYNNDEVKANKKIVVNHKKLRIQNQVKTHIP